MKQNIFVISIIATMVACNKAYRKFDMEVGKYQITQYRTFNDGSKDTLTCIGYGPSGVVNKGYVFQTSENNVSNAFWGNDVENLRLGHFLSSSSKSEFEIKSFFHSKEYIEVYYEINSNYSSNNLDTSVSGKVTFKRLPL